MLRPYTDPGVIDPGMIDLRIPADDRPINDAPVHGSVHGARPRQRRKEIRIPAATAEPITPETFGPIACMSR